VKWCRNRGGADLGVPCEEQYDWHFVRERIDAARAGNRTRYGIDFAVVTYSEGARITGMTPPPGEVSYCDYDLPKLQPEWIGMELVRLSKEAGMPAAFQAHTYDMRDTPPTETDKQLSRMAGEECIKMVLEGDFGKATVFEPDGQGFFKTGRAPLQDVSVQRTLKPTGFFDYGTLEPNPSFVEAYRDLFTPSLGMPPAKNDLVYKNLLGPHSEPL